MVPLPCVSSDNGNRRNSKGFDIFSILPKAGFRMNRPPFAVFTWLACFLIASGWLALAHGAVPENAAALPLDFAHDIRPILADACYHCHGPDEAHREADLRLDDFASATIDLGGYAAIVPQNAEQSEMWNRIISTDVDEVMPPPHSGKKLDAKAIALLKRWINEGAEYADHWAFEPPVQAPLPKVEKADWPNGAIDSFALARLEQENLSPSPEASREALIRRLSLDLIGLPPTPEEVDAFVNDASPNAYEHLVKRLLESVHYGEKWGRVWLDAARYADSDGFEKDKPRFVWFYRDWVVRALNADMPYDEFVIKQIAGDMLPGATQDDRVATGFLRNSMINEEGGVDPEQFRMEAMYDRMDAIGKSVLGLTIQCAQCHFHKYDPVSHTDYYRMFAFLNNSHESSITVYTLEQLARKADVENRIESIHQSVKDANLDWKSRLTQWEQSVQPSAMTDWKPLTIEFNLDTQGGQKFLVQDDGSYLAQGYAPTKTTPTGDVLLDSLNRITAIRVEVLNDPNLPHGGPGRSVDGTWALSELELSTNQNGEWKKVKFASALATVEPEIQPLGPRYADKSKNERLLGPSSMAIDGKPHSAWHGDMGPERRNEPHAAMFVLAEPIVAEEGKPLVFRIGLAQNQGGWNSDDNQTHNLGRFRVSATADNEPIIDLMPPRIRETLNQNPLRRTPPQESRLLDYWISQNLDWKDYTTMIEAAWSDHPDGTSQLVLAERESRRTTHRLDRGDFLSPQEAVASGTPIFLHPLETSAPESAGQPTRLDFANWLVSRNSPTTARSLVNRVWQEYFGTGLSATSDDLGLQSEPPSHPELLDWLAVDLMQKDWSLKHLHQQIVISKTYQQNSAVSNELLEADPQNRLLARGPRFRVSAETVRDIALTASGLLNRNVGGPPVYPDAPSFLFEPPASYGPKVWDDDTDGDQYRRALYTFRFRSVPYPAYQAFDAPTGEVSCVRRSLSNTPLQALTTLNEPMFLECARELAKRSSDVNDDEARIDWIFRRCVSRRPSNDERTILRDLLNQQRQRFETDTEAASKLIGLKESSDDVASSNDQAAWTVLCRVVMNLDETITKE